MHRLDKLLTLDLLPRLGVYRLNKKIQQRDPISLFSLSHQELSLLGFNDAQIAILLNPPTEKLATIHTWLSANPQRTVISYHDDNYPSLLKQLSAPPMLLFCHGNIDLLARSQLAMVGSRAASFSGKETALLLAEQLSLQGYVITSGLATGIDSYAHQGALKASGDTIAVLGSGLDNLYPRSNIGLANAIVEKGGLIISEFWPHVTPYAANFPRRNRIVSGLALGVIVVEAEQRSGSLITARLAVEQNREVFAVPGAINNPKAMGCHQLIHQGAKLITGIADILDELPCLAQCKGASEHEISHEPAKSNQSFDSLLDCIDFEVTSIDQVVIRSALAVEEVQERITMLELTGLITSVSGGYIRLKGDT